MVKEEINNGSNDKEEEKTPKEVSSSGITDPSEGSKAESDAKNDEASVKEGESTKEGSPPQAEEEKFEIVERVVKISRVSKVVKGGKNFSFNALVVAGDAHGSVGIGFGKSNEVAEAIKKGAAQAKVSFLKINLKGDTIPHAIIGRFKATRVLLKPAGPGTGVIAGGPVRALCDATGIKNILTKSLGSRNAINVVKATINGLENLRLKRRV